MKRAAIRTGRSCRLPTSVQLPSGCLRPIQKCMVKVIGAGGNCFALKKMVEVRPVPMRVRNSVGRIRRNEQLVAAVRTVVKPSAGVVMVISKSAFQPTPISG